MNNTTYTQAQMMRFERLAAKLAQIPENQAREIDERAAIFVTGLESGLKISQNANTAKTTAPEASA